MSTNIKPDDFLASLTKWGVNWRFYKDKADWLVHNRNKAGNNVNATPGGFGPLRGGAAHNTASTSQTGMLAYLYNGDSARALPGPLCNWAILKTGEVVLMGWGTSNATGPGDPKADALVRNDKMPLDTELVPTIGAITDPRAILYAPYYQGWEACHAAEGPTPEQYKSVVLAACAYLDLLGAGYTGGSVVMHRELTTQRSDPQGVPKNGQLRRDINARLKAGPPSATKPPEVPSVPVAPTKKPSPVTLTAEPEAITLGMPVTLTAKATPALPGGFAFQYQEYGGSNWVTIRSQRTTDGTSVLVMKPTQNTNYRVTWWPDDTSYERGNDAFATVVVVDLLRLMTEHRTMQGQIAELQAGSTTVNTTPGG